MATQDTLIRIALIIDILITIPFSTSSVDALTIIFNLINSNLDKVCDFGCAYDNYNNTAIIMNNICFFYWFFDVATIEYKFIIIIDNVMIHQQ